MDFFLDSCFIGGYDIRANSLRNLDSAATAYHCQLECKKDDDCSFFTYDDNIGRCFLKTGALGTIVGSFVISGPKTCTRMIG